MPVTKIEKHLCQSKITDVAELKVKSLVRAVRRIHSDRHQRCSTGVGRDISEANRVLTTASSEEVGVAQTQSMFSTPWLFETRVARSKLTLSLPVTANDRSTCDVAVEVECVITTTSKMITLLVTPEPVRLKVSESITTKKGGTCQTTSANQEALEHHHEIKRDLSVLQ